MILAAGGSTRMGQPKAALTIGEQTLLGAHVRALRSHCARITVTTGAHHDVITKILENLGGAHLESIHNPNWAQTGPAESLALALATVPATANVVVIPVDCSPASEAVLTALLSAPAPAVPSYRGQRGHPVVVRAGPTRRALERGTLRAATERATEVQVDEKGILDNFNTPAEFGAWLAQRDVSQSGARRDVTVRRG